MNNHSGEKAYEEKHERKLKYWGKISQLITILSNSFFYLSNQNIKVKYSSSN